MTVCAGETRRKHLFTTNSNYVQIQIVKTGQNEDGSAYFAIAYEGIVFYTFSSGKIMSCKKWRLYII